MMDDGFDGRLKGMTVGTTDGQRVQFGTLWVDTVSHLSSPFSPSPAHCIEMLINLYDSETHFAFNDAYSFHTKVIYRASQGGNYHLLRSIAGPIDSAL